ncbi:hypothetical protein E2I00_014453, partial [Balaenoptera physalus]
ETSVVEVALVAAVVVVDMVAVVMAIMDLVMMEAILEVVEATEETLEAEVLAPMVVEANTLPNPETKVAMVVPAAAVAVAVAEGFAYCQETKLSRRGEPEK